MPLAMREPFCPRCRRPNPRAAVVRDELGEPNPTDTDVLVPDGVPAPDASSPPLTAGSDRGGVFVAPVASAVAPAPLRAERGGFLRRLRTR